MACASSCKTKTHASYGECLRDKGLSIQVEVPGTGYSPAKNKAWDSRIDAYKDARRQGVAPAGTKRSQIDAAVRASDSAGEAFTAS